jgi:hypothetical protein
VKKKMIRLWKKQGESRGGRLGEGVILTRRGTVRRLCPTHYSITARLCHSIAHRAPSRSRSHTSPFTYVGRRRGGAMMSGPLVNGNSQTAAPFQFPFIVLLQHGRGAIFNLQPSSSSPPSTSILVTNFIPLQLQSSLPTSSLVAANFNPCRHSNSKPRRCAISSILLDGCRGVLDAAAAR